MPTPRRAGKKGVSPILRKKLHIRSRQGLHARPAALFVQVANRFQCTIRVRKGREEVDGKSIMGLLTLAASKGSTLEVILQGPDGEDALRALEQLICRSEPPAVVTIQRHRPPHGSTAHSSPA